MFCDYHGDGQLAYYLARDVALMWFRRLLVSNQCDVQFILIIRRSYTLRNGAADYGATPLGDLIKSKIHSFLANEKTQ